MIVSEINIFKPKLTHIDFKLKAQFYFIREFIFLCKSRYSDNWNGGTQASRLQISPILTPRTYFEGFPKTENYVIVYVYYYLLMHDTGSPIPPPPTTTLTLE